MAGRSKADNQGFTGGQARAPKPMDDGIRERSVGQAANNHQRVCGALKTLVAELEQMFPETPVEYSNYNRYNAALAVTFDLTALDGGDSVIFNDAIGLIKGDDRVAEVMTADYDQAYVEMRDWLRTCDNREPFGLADALVVLLDDVADEDSGSW